MQACGGLWRSTEHARCFALLDSHTLQSPISACRFIHRCLIQCVLLHEPTPASHSPFPHLSRFIRLREALTDMLLSQRGIGPAIKPWQMRKVTGSVVSTVFIRIVPFCRCCYVCCPHASHPHTFTALRAGVCMADQAPCRRPLTHSPHFTPPHLHSPARSNTRGEPRATPSASAWRSRWGNPGSRRRSVQRH